MGVTTSSGARSRLSRDFGYNNIHRSQEQMEGNIGLICTGSKSRSGRKYGCYNHHRSQKPDGDCLYKSQKKQVTQGIHCTLYM